MFGWGYIEGVTGSMRNSILALVGLFLIAFVILAMDSQVAPRSLADGLNDAIDVLSQGAQKGPPEDALFWMDDGLVLLHEERHAAVLGPRNFAVASAGRVRVLAVR